MLEERKKVLVAGAQCTSWLPSGSRCGYLLDNHSPVVHLTDSTPGEAVLHGREAPTLIPSQNGYSYVLHALPESRHAPVKRQCLFLGPLNLGDFVTALMKMIQ